MKYNRKQEQFVYSLHGQQITPEGDKGELESGVLLMRMRTLFMTSANYFLARHEYEWEELNNYQFPWPPPLVRWFLNEATVDSALLDALEQFEDQATNRLFLSALVGCEDPGTKDEKTPAKMLPSTLHILYVSST